MSKTRLLVCELCGYTEHYLDREDENKQIWRCSECGYPTKITRDITFINEPKCGHGRKSAILTQEDNYDYPNVTYHYECECCGYQWIEREHHKQGEVSLEKRTLKNLMKRLRKEAEKEEKQRELKELGKIFLKVVKAHSWKCQLRELLKDTARELRLEPFPEIGFFVIYQIEIPHNVLNDKTREIIKNRGYPYLKESLEEYVKSLKHLFLYFNNRRKVFAEWLRTYIWTGELDAERELNRLGIARIGFGSGINQEGQREATELLKKVYLESLTLDAIKDMQLSGKIPLAVEKAIEGYVLGKYRKETLGSQPVKKRK